LHSHHVRLSSRRGERRQAAPGFTGLKDALYKKDWLVYTTPRLRHVMAPPCFATSASTPTASPSPTTASFPAGKSDLCSRTRGLAQHDV
jgi:hypothetical protein